MFEKAETRVGEQIEWMLRGYSFSLISSFATSNDKRDSGTWPAGSLFVNLISIPLPIVVGLPLTGAAPKILDCAFDIIVTGHVPQVLANLFVHTFAHGAEFFAGSFEDLLVNGKCNIH
jgi:hypothetical protein